MKGILFKEEMFHAASERRKTQTRRIVKLPEGAFGFQICKRVLDGAFVGIYAYDENERTIKPGTEQEWLIKPRYKIGETVYLKEPYIESTDGVYYKFDHKDLKMILSYGYEKQWQNKLFMPVRCARNFIKITNVRCERLQDISEENCITEGIYFHEEYGTKGFTCDAFPNFAYSTAKEAYETLWVEINGKSSWNENPPVWVYEFELMKS